MGNSNGKKVDSSKESTLPHQGLKAKQARFITENGENHLENPEPLSQELAIDVEQAKTALETDKNKQISKEIIEDTLTEENSDDLHNDEFFDALESDSITESQKLEIKEKVNAGFSITEIADELEIPETEVKDFVDVKLITFSGKEGQIILEIITKTFEKYPKMKLRKLIVTKNVKLQEQICCQLPKTNEKEYKNLRQYFMKFEESQFFFEIDEALSIEEKECIRSSSLDDIEELSIKLNRMQKIIRDYLLQYYLDESLILHYTEVQLENIKNIRTTFKMDEQISHTTYREIISDSFDNIIHNAIKPGKEPKIILNELLPLAFYYLKCSLPLKEFTQIIAKIPGMSLTTLDIFHIIFQMSDPIVRGLCIEHYSFSNPVPLYYPRLELYGQMQGQYQFEICKELWYTLQQFNGLVSFGLGWASWNPIGKSHLLDLMFETDFVKGSPQNSPFHFGSIDIQMTKNLFGNKEKNINEPTQWAYFDCHGYSDVNVITEICKNIHMVLIHVSSTDFKENFTRLEEDIIRMTEKAQHVYLLVRDHPGNDIEKKEELIGKKPCSIIFVPHLIKQDKDLCPDLKELGYKILHSTSVGEIYVDSIFLEHLIMEFGTENNLEKEKLLIQRIIVNHISTNKEGESDFSSLNYYPLFIEYMKSFYKTSSETEQKAIDKLNKECGILDRKLKITMMSEIVFHFNEILAQENSTLILWKLAQELKIRGGKYNLEILWREALLSNKYNACTHDNEVRRFTEELSSNFSNHVKRGEPFELIDGDNLRFFNQDIDALLSDLYDNQSQINCMNEKNNEKNMKKRPPIVISIFGPQSSGKSTLLNYCFGCKFLTSAGRCTKGVYGSLSKLSQPINHSDHFLILDTEGLDSIEKGKVLKETSCIHFDRTMVLFCLAVSQVVIINVRGDIGEEMRNILQICAYSLNKLKVSKVSAPKIFFVLNQQANPDPKIHLSSINTLLEDLRRESYLMEADGLTISELLQVSSENLFVLSSAFNSVCVNTQVAKLFDSYLNKLSPTLSFANKCADLRMSIIQQLNDDKTSNNQTPFTTMSEWMEMSGVIWDTIVKYQDIVKYRNVEELKCSIKLSKLISDLLESKIYSNKGEYRQITENLIQKIKKIENWSPPKGILEDVKIDLDEVFKKYQEEALTKFAEQCKADPLLKKMNYMCDDAKSNLNRLIFMEKKIYEDKLRLEIKARLNEIKISEKMTKFQEAIEKNADQYLELNIEQQEREFHKIWENCFGSDKKEEEGSERDEMFDDLYSVFRIESKTMENKQTIYSHFRDFNFDMDNIIQTLRGEILTKFCEEPNAFAGTEQFLYPWKENKVPLKDMTPYIGRIKCDYLTKESLWISSEVQNKGRDKKHNLKFQEWVPLECHSLIQYCSGHYNHPDVVWNLEKRKQILLLASLLKDPENLGRSTWDKFISDIATRVSNFIEKDPNISHSTVKVFVNFLCNICRVVNYEINYIEAKLTNIAERTISTFAFAFAFKSLLGTKTAKQRESKLNFNEKKDNDLKYFLQKVENRKMVRGNWDRKEMRKGDQTIANKFADDLLESVLRGVKRTCEQNIKEDYFNEKKDKLSHKSLLLLANKKITRELDKTVELNPITEDNFVVVQFICNQTQTLRNLFEEEWLKVANELQDRIVENMKKQFTKQISTIRAVLEEILDGIIALCASLDRPDGIGFDSDSNFVVACETSTKGSARMPDPKAREAPLKSMVLFLQMYLNPKVTPVEFNQFFNNSFKIDGVKIEKNRKDYVLHEKPYNPTEVLTEELFKKLIETKMFSSSETIFNIKIYGEEFLSSLKCYEFQVSQTNYEKLLKPTKEEFETRVINCPYQCPSCGKFCEREIHPHEGKCQIMTGHQLFSMGGKVWNTNEERTAILLMCEDYRDDSPVLIPGQNMKWWEFKEKCGDQWDWSLPDDENYVALQMENQEKMKNIWNKFGREILQYYANKGTQVKYIPYTTSREIYESLFPVNYYVCFVIDGTKLMRGTIIHAKQRVSDIIRDFEGESNFKVIVYHGDCSNEFCVEKFPNNSDFTSDINSIQDFLENVSTNGDEDNEFPMLHGLATAAKECQWKSYFGFKNTIVHIYVEPTQGHFDFHTATGKCEKCEKGCQFDWKRDISDIMEQFKIEYKKESYINRRHPDYSRSHSGSQDCKPKSSIFINFKPDN